MDGEIIFLAFLICLPFLAIFIALIIMPAIKLAISPWLRRENPEKFMYSALLIGYLNWIYVICACASKIPAKKFYKKWVVYSAIYSATITFLLVIIMIPATSGGPICSFGLFLLLIPVDIFLRSWIGKRVYEQYLYSGHKVL